jgi:hypothetical protein
MVMPKHFHLVVCEPRKGTPSKVLQVLKQKVSGALRGEGKVKIRTLKIEGCGTQNLLAALSLCHTPNLRCETRIRFL